MTRDDALALDAADPLAPLRDQFVLAQGAPRTGQARPDPQGGASRPAEPDRLDGTIYLDGNSLGVLPKTAAARVQQVLADEWGQGLIRSWNDAGWIDLPRRIGDKIARLVGAGAGELVVADSTSVNLYKVLSAALAMAAPRRRIVSERGNFPTDLYIAESLTDDLLLVDGDAGIPLSDRTAVLMLTHVDYRSGRMHDMAALTRAAHAAGALAVWDLAHSAGAVPVDLTAADADFAVGCGYKYLNGGPGAPAFVWVHPRHADAFRQPLAGWMGHAAPFEFMPGYRPAPGIARYLCGTPPVLSLAALECGVDSVLAAEPLGGMAALRAKSLALTRLFADEVARRCPALRCVTPLDDARRGSQVSFAHAEHGYAIVQALIARGVIGDFRHPDLLRFGFTPLYLRHVDAWDAAAHLQAVIDGGEWRRPEFNRRNAVT